jgi:hypothetical protein
MMMVCWASAVPATMASAAAVPKKKCLMEDNHRAGRCVNSYQGARPDMRREGFGGPGPDRDSGNVRRTGSVAAAQVLEAGRIETRATG